MEHINLKIVIKPLTLAIALSIMSHAQAVGNGTIVSGSGSISKSGNTTTVKQINDKMIVNWNNMNVGKSETLNFNQSTGSAVLNKISSTNPTLIQGALNASGKVFIVNPNGVLISKGATVNVGSLVASSLNITNDDFNHDLVRFNGNGNGRVINSGKITAQEAVMLLGGTNVINNGTISSKTGEIGLAAGHEIILSFPASQKMTVKVNEGSLKALVRNGGIIINEDGNVSLTAWATDNLIRSVVNNTGTIEANGIQGLGNGVIRILAYRGTGNVEVSGKLKSNIVGVWANNIAVRDGATINTSGATKLSSTKLNGYVRIGSANFVSGGGLSITADNVISSKLAGNAKLGGDLYLRSPNGHLTLSNNIITNEKKLKPGNGVVSADILDAMEKQPGRLFVYTSKGDINLNHEINQRYVGLNAVNGNVNLNNKITASDVFLYSGNNIRQATNASLNVGLLNFQTNGANPFVQNANIISSSNAYMDASGGIVQNNGVKTSAVGDLSMKGSSFSLNGVIAANKLQLDSAQNITQGKGSSITATEAYISGGDAIMNGNNHINKVSVSVNNMRLTSETDVDFFKRTTIYGDFDFKSNHNIKFSDYLIVRGDANINTIKDVSFLGDTSVSKTLAVTADKVLISGVKDHLISISANDVRLTAKNDIVLTNLNKADIYKDLVVNAGRNAKFDGEFHIRGNANITASENASFFNRFVTDGKRNVSAKTVTDKAITEPKCPSWDYHYINFKFWQEMYSYASFH